ncbi:MAG: 4'-phosphopantetheinyl transferase superfamily protein [Spongiibacteraceae bacterium]
MIPARIDILCCALPDIEAGLLAHYENLLSEDELRRLRSFRSPSGAKEFLVGRALLRTALAERINCNPHDLQFSKNADGKPTLASPQSRWQFNLTHSHDWVALALCEGSTIGIDIESYKRRNNLSGIAKRFFSDAENAQLNRCDESEWLDLFFAVWTLKEAHAKALGCGLPKILNCSSVDVDLVNATIDFSLSEAAVTPHCISSWLFKFGIEVAADNCALALVAHGDRFETPRLQRCIPLLSIADFAVVELARGQQQGR